MICTFNCRTYTFEHTLVSQNNIASSVGSKSWDLILEITECIAAASLLFSKAEPWGSGPQSCSFSLALPLVPIQL